MRDICTDKLISYYKDSKINKATCLYILLHVTLSNGSLLSIVATFL